ncbi:cupin domain-containing protein [Tamlana sp. 2201CG12-4]|uniref:cupin domain-containing protein n=1 Tax=Tamlana sp. 2201CG12-4 TaxID=3112582 RepID=UPI002DBE3644|nr:cupin domain-containing protein [Tamlana sp. 2201CG12-4]MEC3905497.1 cupin domain-containing protein [Tamlana sp. 2201CG12-4]
MSIDFSKVPGKELVKGVTGKYIHSKTFTVGYVTIEEGAIMPSHSHVHEQTTQVISGQLEMTIDDKTEILKDGMITIIPSNATHSARALSKCQVIDTFYPIREDYK